MMSQRWMAVADPAFPWEREALTYVRERLPDQEPFRAWSNFEFIAEDGSINEVDLLVVSLYRVYLVEIKSRPGQVSGDAGTWTWSHDGRLHTEDNPLLLANRKAKKLRSLLQPHRPSAIAARHISSRSFSSQPRGCVVSFQARRAMVCIYALVLSQKARPTSSPSCRGRPRPRRAAKGLRRRRSTGDCHRR